MHSITITEKCIPFPHYREKTAAELRVHQYVPAVEDHEVPEVCRGNDLSRSRCLMMNGAGLGHDVSAM